MIILLIFTLFSCSTYIFIERRREIKQIDLWVNSISENQQNNDKINAIDLREFDLGFMARIKRNTGRIMKVFYPNASLKISIFFFLSLLVIYFINDLFFRYPYWVCVFFVEPISLFFFYNHLKCHQEKIFRSQFPDALNILVSAISSGRGITQAFEYVGNQMDNNVGKEFEYMANRLLIGEDPDDVLERSSQRFPYLEYFFFVSAIRVNIARGGQLKEIMARISRLIFVSRNIEKKRNSLTSEARMSAKIIGCLPIAFLLILYFTNVDNFNFVMYEEAGRPIFYYVLISELVGFSIIRAILRGVQ